MGVKCGRLKKRKECFCGLKKKPEGASRVQVGIWRWERDQGREEKGLDEWKKKAWM